MTKFHAIFRKSETYQKRKSLSTTKSWKQENVPKSYQQYCEANRRKQLTLRVQMREVRARATTKASTIILRLR